MSVIALLTVVCLTQTGVSAQGPRGRGPGAQGARGGMMAVMMLSQEPACQTTTIASAGGPLPKNQNVTILRFLGTANYELSYRDQVILFDTFYSRVPPARPLGVLPEQFKRANGIFIGHGHWDHIADIPVVGASNP